MILQYINKTNFLLLKLTDIFMKKVLIASLTTMCNNLILAFPFEGRAAISYAFYMLSHNRVDNL